MSRWFLLLTAACAPAPGLPPEPVDTGGELPEPEVLRVVTWNVAGVGLPGDDAFEAAVDILGRLDADVVGLNEVELDEDDALDLLAEATGYSWVQLPADNPFGPLRNAVLSRRPLSGPSAWSSATLSGDPAANDQTRLPVSATVPLDGGDLTVVVQHWKAGFDAIDAFRRAVESHRVTDVTRRTAGELVLVMGDMNHEVDQGPGDPAIAWAVPSEAPGSWRLGADLDDRMRTHGLETDPFVALQDEDLRIFEARQPNGDAGTRHPTGRRIDYILGNPDAHDRFQGALIYNSLHDDGQADLPLAGVAPGPNASRYASDHYPVVVDLMVSAPVSP